MQLTDNVTGNDPIDAKIVVLRGNDGLITQGLIVGQVLNQNQAMILIANPAEFHFNPTIGVAIDQLILDNDYLRFRHRIREHLIKDGIKVNSLQLQKGMPLQIQSEYER